MTQYFYHGPNNARTVTPGTRNLAGMLCWQGIVVKYKPLKHVDGTLYQHKVTDTRQEAKSNGPTQPIGFVAAELGVWPDSDSVELPGTPVSSGSSRTIVLPGVAPGVLLGTLRSMYVVEGGGGFKPFDVGEVNKMGPAARI